MVSEMSSAEISEWGAYFGLLAWEKETGVSLDMYDPEDFGV